MSERVAGFKCAICERVGSCAPVDEQYAWARSARTRGDAGQYTRARRLVCVRATTSGCVGSKSPSLPIVEKCQGPKITPDAPALIGRRGHRARSAPIRPGAWARVREAPIRRFDVCQRARTCTDGYMVATWALREVVLTLGGRGSVIGRTAPG